MTFLCFISFQNPYNLFTFDLVDRPANEYFHVSLTGELAVKTPVSGDLSKTTQYDVSISVDSGNLV